MDLLQTYVLEFLFTFMCRDCHWHLQKQSVAALIYMDIAVGISNSCKKPHCSSISSECAHYW